MTSHFVWASRTTPLHKQGAGISFGANGDQHTRAVELSTYFCVSTIPLPFESREEVLAWICKNQLGRRNLTPEQKYYLMGKQYEAEKAAHGGDRKSIDAKSSSLKANLIDNSKTCDRIAEENGVSKDTVIRVSKYMKGVEIAEERMPGLKAEHPVRTDESVQS